MSRTIHVHLHRGRRLAVDRALDSPSVQEVEQARNEFARIRAEADQLASDPSTTGKLKLSVMREKMRRLRFQFGEMITDARPCGCGH